MKFQLPIRTPDESIEDWVLRCFAELAGRLASVENLAGRLTAASIAEGRRLAALEGAVKADERELSDLRALLHERSEELVDQIQRADANQAAADTLERLKRNGETIEVDGIVLSLQPAGVYVNAIIKINDLSERVSELGEENRDLIKERDAIAAENATLKQSHDTLERLKQGNVGTFPESEQMKGGQYMLYCRRRLEELEASHDTLERLKRGEAVEGQILTGPAYRAMESERDALAEQVANRDAIIATFRENKAELERRLSDALAALNAIRREIGPGDVGVIQAVADLRREKADLQRRLAEAERRFADDPAKWQCSGWLSHALGIHGNSRLDAAIETIAALRRNAERWEEVERRVEFLGRLPDYSSRYAIAFSPATRQQSFAERVDAAIAARKAAPHPRCLPVQVTDAEPEPPLCDSCGGSGRAEDQYARGGTRCSTCDGTGKAQAPTCPKCGGPCGESRSGAQWECESCGHRWLKEEPT